MKMVKRDSAVPQDTTAFELESFVPYRFSLLANTVSQGIAETYRHDLELSVTQWRIIAVLGRFPGQTASQVTQRTAMDKVAVSRAVKSLLERGLVERSLHNTDRRRKHLRLTEKSGQRLHAMIVPRAESYEAKLLAGLKPGELASLNRLLLKLQSTADSINRLRGTNIEGGKDPD